MVKYLGKAYSTPVMDGKALILKLQALALHFLAIGYNDSIGTLNGVWLLYGEALFRDGVPPHIPSPTTLRTTDG